MQSLLLQVFLAYVWILLCTKLHALFSFWAYKPLRKHSPRVFVGLLNIEVYNVPRFWVPTDTCTVAMYQTLLSCWEGPENKASLVHTKLKFCFNRDWHLYWGGLVMLVCYSSPGVPEPVQPVLPWPDHFLPTGSAKSLDTACSSLHVLYCWLHCQSISVWACLLEHYLSA